MDGYIGLEQSWADRPQRAAAYPRDGRGPGAQQPFKPLIFLHIPKTAGTSMMELLGRNFSADEVFRVTDIHRPAIDVLAEVEVALAESGRLVYGHFCYDVIAPIRDQVVPFTMLRDPVDRVVSLYRFWRTQEPRSVTGAAAQFACAIARSLCFDAFLACEHPLIVSATRDEMCRSLSPDSDHEAANGDPMTRFGKAKATLDTMPFGLVERMRDSLRLLSYRLGVSLVEPVSLNTACRPDLASPTPEQREAIIRSNLGDMALYAHASRRFSRAVEQLEIELLYRGLGDRALSPLTPLPGGQFRWDAAMSLCGTGWNDREALADGSCYRFTSSPETVIYFPNVFSEIGFFISVRVAFFHSDALWGRHGHVNPEESLHFAVNDAPLAIVAVSRMSSEVTYKVHVEALDSLNPILKFSIGSDYGLSPRIFGSSDERNILAAVLSITLEA